MKWNLLHTDVLIIHLSKRKAFFTEDTFAILGRLINKRLSKIKFLILKKNKIIDFSCFVRSALRFVLFEVFRENKVPFFDYENTTTKAKKLHPKRMAHFAYHQNQQYLLLFLLFPIYYRCRNQDGTIRTAEL